MQSKTLFKIAMLIIGLIAIYILIQVGIRASEKTSLNTPDNLSATSTEQTAETVIDLNRKYATTEVKSPTGIIKVMIASSSDEMMQGLSGRESMNDDAGMLFIFPEVGEYGFWMKDMKFSIDIVWIDAEKKVIGIESDVTPETYPSVYYPESEIEYALELNSGAAEKFGIAVGTKLVF